jgi:acetolactate synthase I/III small subunit
MPNTLIVYTENRSDILARVAMLFHRRVVPIRSFQMAPAEDQDVLKIVITTEVEAERLVRLVADLHKLVNVISVVDASQESYSPCSSGQ